MIKKFIKKIVPKKTLIFAKNLMLQAKNKVNNAIWPIKKIINHKTREVFPPKIPRNKDGKVYIHLGCADQKNEKFINVDVEAFPHVHFVQNIKDLSNFPNNSADLIYVSHALEHISHLELDKILREWRRVLKPGGILRLSVPDFDKLIKSYNESGNNIKFIKDALMGGQTYEYNFHKSVFNEKYLSELLKNAGFDNIKKWDAQKDNFGFEDFAKNFRGSLNLEGKKI